MNRKLLGTAVNSEETIDLRDETVPANESDNDDPVYPDPMAERSTDEFQGPFRDGPDPDYLHIIEMDLSRFGWSEFTRIIQAMFVLSWAVLRSLPRRLTGRYKTIGEAVAEGVIDGFIIMGPTYVKLGQVIASSPGLFPDWLAGPARRSLDEVPPFPVELVYQTLADDLGQPVWDLFQSFEAEPLSAASIGQVHACVLHDGREAVVKVQRPGLRESMTRDLRVLWFIARVAMKFSWGRSANATGMVNDLATLTARELNPVFEAWNQHRFREKLWVFGDNKMVTAPEVYWNYCGPHTICMERVYGIPMDNFEEIERRGFDGELVLRRGAKAWAEAVLVHGPFHGDLHAGNIWVLDDGRGCFLDFGIMGELENGWRELARDLYYTCVFDRDFTRIARAYRAIGVFPEDMGTDEEIGFRLGLILGPLLDGGMGSVSLGDLITSSVSLMKDYGGTPPQELMLVGKQLLYIERYTKVLAPDYAVIKDPFLVRNVFPEAAQKYLDDGGEAFPE